MALRWLLALVFVLFAGLAVTYNLSTPYRQPGKLLLQRGPDGGPMPVADVGAPDERQHANYVAHLLDGRGFPVLKPGDPNLYESYQSHQPPMYYLVAAGWMRLAGLSIEERPGGTWLRILSTLIGLATIAGIYWSARWGVESASVAVGASAVGGLMPMSVALHSAASNDPLLFACCTWTLALCAKAIRHGPSVRLSLGTAVVVGIGLLTKTTAVALIPTALVGFYLASKHHRSPTKERATLALFLIAVPLLMALPWWLRNQSLYGDPLAMKAFREAFVGSAQRVDLVRMIEASREARGQSTSGANLEYWTQWFGWWTLRSFFGVFGQMDVFLSDVLYRALSGLAAVSGIGWVLAMLRKSDGLASDPRTRSYHATAGVLLGIVALLFLQFNLTYFQAQARYLYPAIAAIALGLSIGTAFLLGRRRDWTPYILVTLLGALNLYVLSVLNPAFALRTS